MSHPRIEEVSDSDDVLSDPSEADIDDFADSDILRRVEPKQPSQQATTASAAAGAPPPAPSSQILNPSNVPPTSTLAADADRSAFANFQCLYPVYFDANRSRAEGRRVPKSLAVANPLAREIANACSRLRLPTLLEPEKTHPKDWSNPGRVKVGLKKENGALGSPKKSTIANKHHLYILVAQHLKEHPTTEKSNGLRVRVGGGKIQPEEGKPYPKPAVPRGWKMNDLLPYLSAAMTGGGVSENMFQDMMREMQGGADPMSALMAGAGGGAGPSGPAGGMIGAGGAEEGGGKKKNKKGKGKA